MTNKKLGLLLCPLLPLTAIGIVEVASAIAPPPATVVEVREVREVREPVVRPSVQFARPVTPAPTYAPELVAPHPVAKG